MYLVPELGSYYYYFIFVGCFMQLPGTYFPYIFYFFYDDWPQDRTDSRQTDRPTDRQTNNHQTGFSGQSYDRVPSIQKYDAKFLTKLACFRVWYTYLPIMHITTSWRPHTRPCPCRQAYIIVTDWPTPAPPLLPGPSLLLFYFYFFIFYFYHNSQFLFVFMFVNLTILITVRLG